MNRPLNPPDPMRSRCLGRWTVWVISALAFVLAILGIWWFFLRPEKGPATQLQMAEAEADETSPGWRQKDLEANRRILPKVQNSALVIQSLGPKINALQTIERVLAQGQASEVALARLRRVLEKEEAEPLLLPAARSRRADADRIMRAFESGEISVDKLAEILPVGAPFAKVWEKELPSLGNPQGRLKNHAAILSFLNRFVAIARLPAGQQFPLLKKLQANADEQPLLVRLVWQHWHNLVQAYHTNQAQLRCGLAAVAVERYRLKHGSWPGNLDALVPAHLQAVPLYPYDGQPLRSRRVIGGVVIYSIGPDGVDNRGKLNRSEIGARVRTWGCQLWDSRFRRRPPRTR